ncbi:MAG: oligosaccharide flippase family protein [Candidatus Riflebacteria bacterium]
MSLKKNVIANYLGSGWVSVMNILFVPYYIHYLGMESYGLIGFYTMLQTCLTLLDMGMSTTLSREMARFSGGDHSPLTIKDLLRSLEILCFSIAGIYLLGIFASADWVALNWLQAKQLSPQVVSRAFQIMGLVTALRFIEGLYRSAIIGMQKQVTLNLANAFMATMRGFGAVIVLAYLQPTIQAYFFWQSLVSLATLGIFAAILYANLPETARKGRFCRDELKKIWRFAGGIMATTFFAILLTQVDKIILSRILTLEEFGNYSLAATVANILAMLIGPITQAHYPRFSELVSQKNTEALNSVFHCGAQLATIVCGSAAMALFFFGNRIVAIWTGNEEMAERIFWILRIMTLGTFFNTLWHIPYMIQLAFGWSGFAARVNFISVIILVPAMFFATQRWGAPGAAFIWLLLNAGYVFIASHFMFKKIIPTEKWRWFVGDLFLPIIIISGLSWFFFHARPTIESQFLELTYIACAGLISIIFAGIFSFELRESLKSIFKQRFSQGAV